MDNRIITIGIVVTVVIAIGVLFLSKEEAPLGVQAGRTYNIISNVSHVSTSTLTTNAQMIAVTNTDRIALHVQNNGPRAVYIRLQSFANFVAASTSFFTQDRGILITPSSTFSILPENLYVGEIWVSTTTVAQSILVTEYE